MLQRRCWGLFDRMYMDIKEIRLVRRALALIENQEVPDSCHPITESGELVGYCWTWTGSCRREFTTIRAFASPEQISHRSGRVALVIPTKNLFLRHDDHVVNLEGIEVCELIFTAPETRQPSRIENLAAVIREAIEVPSPVR